MYAKICGVTRTERVRRPLTEQVPQLFWRLASRLVAVVSPVVSRRTCGPRPLSESRCVHCSYGHLPADSARAFDRLDRSDRSQRRDCSGCNCCAMHCSQLRWLLFLLALTKFSTDWTRRETLYAYKTAGTRRMFSVKNETLLLFLFAL